PRAWPEGHRDPLRRWVWNVLLGKPKQLYRAGKMDPGNTCRDDSGGFPSCPPLTPHPQMSSSRLSRGPILPLAKERMGA
ncbi:MAG: hypothetical protein ABL894_12970, partial [Hyphomicrobium sp.]